MARENKKTRIKGTPPRLQLQQIDSATGSYPTTVRFSTDGRTGQYNINYNDQRTIVFDKNVARGGWQNNLVAYWTMQRVERSSNVSASIIFPSELPGTLSQAEFPFLDFNAADFGFDEAVITEYGTVEDYPTGFKAYDVTANKIFPTDNATQPLTSSIRDYKFIPRFSAFVKSENVSGWTYPLLTQDTDSDKSICAFDGDWPTGPQPFTMAGWFKFNDLDTSQNYNYLVLGPMRTGTLSVGEGRDYLISINSTGSVGTSTFRIIFNSGSSASETLLTEGIANSVIYDNWFHLAVTYNGATNRTTTNPKGLFNSASAKFFLNGQPINVVGQFSNGNFNGFVSGTNPIYGVSFLQTEIDTGISMTGSLGEVAFFNKELSLAEVQEIYSCRVPLNKKGLVVAGTSIYLDNNPKPVESSEHITNINKNGMLPIGSVVKGVGDDGEWLHFTPGQEPTPFRDNGNPAVDGKSQNNAFFATGSLIKDVGDGFDSPLWSKNKIEIDLSAVSSINLGGHLGPVSTGDDRVMAYFDHGNKTWVKIGSSTKATAFYSASNTAGTVAADYFSEKAIGFPQSLIYTNAASNLDVFNLPRIGREFGFPFAEKYSVHSTSSVLYSLENKISQPFLLEKIVLEFSGTYSNGDFITDWGGGAVGCAASNFFILNQKSNVNINQQTVTLTPLLGSAPVDLTQSYQATNSNYMEFVTSLCLFTPGIQKQNWYNGTDERATQLSPFLEANGNLNYIFSFDNFGQYWSGKYLISGSCVSPAYKEADLYTAANPVITSMPITIRTGSGGIYQTSISTFGNRQNVDKLSDSRSFRNPAIGFVQTALFDPSVVGTFKTNSKAMAINPYILYPNDKLIFGWQAPFNGRYYENQLPDFITVKASSNGSTMPNLTIAAGPAKVILYGSYIQNGHEYNDGTNQLLSSNTVHEVIE